MSTVDLCIDNALGVNEFKTTTTASTHVTVFIGVKYNDNM